MTTPLSSESWFEDGQRPSDRVQVDLLLRRVTDLAVRYGTVATISEASDLAEDVLRAVEMWKSQIRPRAEIRQINSLAAAPEPTGVDLLLLEPAGLVADVLRAAKRRAVQQGEVARYWSSAVQRVGDAMLEIETGERWAKICPNISDLTPSRWASGKEPVDRLVLVAAMKLARVEHADELRPAGVPPTTPKRTRRTAA